MLAPSRSVTFGGRRQDCFHGNGTVLNDPPLVHDLLLRWHIQGNCLCIQTAQNQLLVARVELQVLMEVKELLRVVATEAQ